MSVLSNPNLVMAINLVAILIMSGCLYMAVRLRARVAGGQIKKKIDYLFWLILFFTAGYLVPPFLSWLPEDIRPLLVSVLFVGGAIYVIISVKLVDDIIQALSE